MDRFWNIVFVLLCTSVAWKGGYCDGLQSASLSENDDDYISPKDIVLEKSYHGLIRENETLVEITPLIKVDEEKICNFRILKKPYHEIPFQIDLVNNLGILKARHFLNCEKRKSYHFEIVAVYCDGTHSAPANVHISVIDINEYVPTFLQPSYVTEVEEGRLYKEIIRVEATDKDCTPLFGDICKYEILNNDQPFIIDNEGSVKNTEPLSHKIAHNHILSVVAYDCAMQVSAPIMVSIKVRRVCEAKFLGIPERIDYTTSSGEHLLLFPNARLELCDLCSEQNLNIRTSVALRTKYISFGCDRDIKKCPKVSKLIDLLPQGAAWTKTIRSDEGVEPVFHFDGTSGVIVPNGVIPEHDFSIRSFSVMAMFRHLSLPKNNKHVKEHIICSADDHKMNRHHMALFVRNCRLIFLLRKNFNEGDLNIFSPAEWRWKVPQVCDNEWHHYILNVEKSGKIDLFIDGVRFENSHEDQHSNPEVIDDWPLHAAHGVNTTIAVGACYQSSENALKHGFNGDISEIKILLDRVFSNEDVKCGTSCAEHLIAPPESLLEYDTQIQTNSQLNEIFIEGQSKANIEKLLQNIQYVNSKENPTVGRRNIEVRTTAMCVNQSAIRIPTIETYVMVNEPSLMRLLESKNRSNSQKNALNIVALTTEAPAPVNSIDMELIEKKPIKKMDNNNLSPKITGASNKLVSYPEIKNGVHILNDINISITKNGNTIMSNNNYKLDSCSVIVFPSLNPDHEEIEVVGDDALSSTLDIKTSINKDGVEVVGHDKISNYLNILKALVYSNKKPAYYLNRVFKLSCSQQNTQLKTVEFTLTLTVLHPKQSVAQSTYSPAQVTLGNSQMTARDYNNAGGMQNSENKVFAHAMLHTHEVQEPKSRLHTIAHKAESTHPIMFIVLVSVFLVILLVGVSIARIKNNVKDNDQTSPKVADESLVWDDTALTITINPMQADSVSDDSSESENSDTEDEEVTKGRYTNVSQLEWDNSNIFTSHVN